MYKIEVPDIAIVQEQLPTLKAKITDQIERFLPSKNHAVLSKVINSSKLTLDVQVVNGGLTEWFLNWLTQSNNLELLLTGSMDELLRILKMVEDKRAQMNLDERLVYKRINKKTYIALFNGGKDIKNHKYDTIDDFNTIFHEIFVKQGYEGKDSVTYVPIFDKTKHVKGLRLRICPYCGRSYIYAVEKGGRVVKPQIDHFLPKSTYPYLALSYFNMIPVCQTCNMIGCKGEYDPMKMKGERPFKLIYPYEYREDDVRFDIETRSSDYFDDNSFEVKMRWNPDLKKGMTEKMKLDEFYKYHNREVGDICRQIRTLESKAKIYYKWFGVPENMFTPSARLLFGFHFCEKNARKELLYKLKKETYEQLINKK